MKLRDNLAANMRRIREERGWSQEAFAAEVGIHRTYATMLESRKRSPTIDVIERMMDALNIDVGDLLGPPPNRRSPR